MPKSYFNRELIDPVSGESVKVLSVERRVRDKDFTKIFAGELLTRLSESDNELPVKNLLKAIKFITELLALAKREDNIVYASISELSRKLMLSRDTTHRYLKSFQQLGLIINVGYGKWQLDPAVFSQLDAEERKGILVQYKAVSEEHEKAELEKERREDADAQQKLWEEVEREIALEAIDEHERACITL